MEELRSKVLTVDLRYPPGLLSQGAVSLFYCLMHADPNSRVPARRLLAEHPWILPAIAALAPLGVKPEPVVQVPNPALLPVAQASVLCIPADAPIAMWADV